MQEKEIEVVTRSLGGTRIYTVDSYKKMFNRDPVTDDGLTVEDFKSPAGVTYRAVKARSSELVAFKSYSTPITNCDGYDDEDKINSLQSIYQLSVYSLYFQSTMQLSFCF